jgi:hypothetical protein
MGPDMESPQNIGGWRSGSRRRSGRAARGHDGDARGIPLVAGSLGGWKSGWLEIGNRKGCRMLTPYRDQGPAMRGRGQPPDQIWVQVQMRTLIADAVRQVLCLGSDREPNQS